MQTINTMAHFGSLIAFLVIAYGSVQLAKDRRLLRDLIAPRKQVHLDWPVAYLARFCRSLGIGFTTELSLHHQNPIKIETLGLRKLLGSGRIHHIRCFEDQGVKQLRLIITMSSAYKASFKDLEQQIALDLMIPTTIQCKGET